MSAPRPCYLHGKPTAVDCVQGWTRISLSDRFDASAPHFRPPHRFLVEVLGPELPESPEAVYPSAHESRTDTHVPLLTPNPHRSARLWNETLRAYTPDSYARAAHRSGSSTSRGTVGTRSGPGTGIRADMTVRDGQRWACGPWDCVAPEAQWWPDEDTGNAEWREEDLGPCDALSRTERSTGPRDGDGASHDRPHGDAALPAHGVPDRDDAGAPHPELRLQGSHRQRYSQVRLPCGAVDGRLRALRMVLGRPELDGFRLVWYVRTAELLQHLRAEVQQQPQLRYFEVTRGVDDESAHREFEEFCDLCRSGDEPVCLLADDSVVKVLHSKAQRSTAEQDRNPLDARGGAGAQTGRRHDATCLDECRAQVDLLIFVECPKEMFQLQSFEDCFECSRVTAFPIPSDDAVVRKYLTKKVDWS